MYTYDSVFLFFLTFYVHFQKCILWLQKRSEIMYNFKLYYNAVNFEINQQTPFLPMFSLLHYSSSDSKTDIKSDRNSA